MMLDLLQGSLMLVMVLILIFAAFKQRSIDAIYQTGTSITNSGKP